MGRVWKQLKIEATNCTDDTCTFMLGCDCSTNRIQKNMRSQVSAAATNSSKGGAKGPTRFKECAELFAELDKYITSKHAKRQACTLIKRSADWLSEAADKKAKTDVSENLSKEADRIKQRERKIQSLEKSLDNRIDEAEVTRRKEMPIDPTNHEGFDYPTAEGASRFGRIRARAQNTEHSMRALIRCVFHSMHMYSHGISMYVCRRQSER